MATPEEDINDINTDSTVLGRAMPGIDRTNR